MKSHSHYEIEDFLADDSFLDWVGGVSNESSAQWDAWLYQYPHKRELVEEARTLALAIRVKPTRELRDDEVQRLVEEVQQRLPHQPRIIGFGLRRIAAGVVLLAGLGAGISWGVSWYKCQQEQVTPYQQLTEACHCSLTEQVNTSTQPIFIRLPDGSTVVLKSGAKLSYDQAFRGTKRIVYLQGEALFEVKRNPDRPFYVYANDLVTKVLGTSFVVNAQAEGDRASVCVLSGRVSVFHRNRSEVRISPQTERKAVILAPNQQIVFQQGDPQLVKEIVKKPQLISHQATVSNFEFSDTALREVFSKLEMAYGVNIIYDEEVMAKCPLTASFTDRPLFEMLTIICKAVEARYEILDGQIIVYGKGC
ncbi:hypothetical protein BWI97_15565 [Siphonobacter sp. BAB-5405]|uniref:FecR family protein n=1 Tax=Siphonobacter sp. BAB-5405 TaxID=1864825 RepID=UPI000C7FC229|nr:FecR family protein [Siphonobacter sp. BAB-5405]PMD94816.1 hypothetical protein BWI97_15565 [Siphonobacter sp. BAB-5405]